MNKMTKTSRYADGGMTMVKKGGKMVPDFAADGKGKMAKGGMAGMHTMPNGKKMKNSAMKTGGCVKKMSRGGGIEVKGRKPCKVV